MRLILTLFLLSPVAATAGGHGVFYTCDGDGMTPFEIEVAASDCQVGTEKGTISSPDPMVCEISGDAARVITMQPDLAVTVEAGGTVTSGTCARK